eukprot:gene23249-1424_t
MLSRDSAVIQQLLPSLSSHQLQDGSDDGTPETRVAACRGMGAQVRTQVNPERFAM